MLALGYCFRGIAEKMVGKLQQRMQHLAGNPLDKAIDIGSLVSKTQLERVKRLTTEGAKAGASLWQPEISLPETGCFFLQPLPSMWTFLHSCSREILDQSQPP